MAITLVTGSAGAYASEPRGEEPPAGGRRPAAKLQLAVGFEGTRAWISAQYRQLGVRKQTTREPLATVIELRHGADIVTVSVGPEGIVVSRGTRTIAVDSARAYEALQNVLGDSPAVFAARAALSELEGEADLRAPEMSLLSSLAFVASLVGDVNAPRRLSDRFVAKYRGAVRPVRRGSCWDSYTQETTTAWNELQTCMDEANQDESFFRAAYRRLACNALWIGRSESAWFEFLGCIQPIKAVK